jgi:predicted N-acetyltransferase YhbS
MTSCHSDFLEAKLLESIGNETEQSVNTRFELVARDTVGQITGGLVASVSYNWLLIKILWVDNAHRNSGIGRHLLSQAEDKAIALGCHSAWLDTSNPNANRFYSNLGYVLFAELKNTTKQIPPNHQRWFLKKTLAKSCQKTMETE